MNLKIIFLCFDKFIIMQIIIHNFPGRTGVP